MAIEPHSGMPVRRAGRRFAARACRPARTSRLGWSMRASRSSWLWKTTARPRWRSRCGEAAERADFRRGDDPTSCHLAGTATCILQRVLVSCTSTTCSRRMKGADFDFCRGLGS